MKLQKDPPSSSSKVKSSTPSVSRVPKTMSRTMQLAQNDALWSRTDVDSSPLPLATTTAMATASATRSHQYHAAAAARTALPHVEQYWAARALTAEALLSAREEHRRELKSLSHEDEARRRCETSRMSEERRESRVGMEKIVFALLASILSLVALVIYLTVQHARHAAAAAAQRSRWFLPSHFTIPVLSPFTSVVEHETSVMSSGTLIAISAVLALLAYAVLRYHLSASRPNAWHSSR